MCVSSLVFRSVQVRVARASNKVAVLGSLRKRVGVANERCCFFPWNLNNNGCIQETELHRLVVLLVLSRFYSERHTRTK